MQQSVSVYQALSLDGVSWWLGAQSTLMGRTLRPRCVRTLLHISESSFRRWYAPGFLGHNSASRRTLFYPDVEGFFLPFVEVSRSPGWSSPPRLIRCGLFFFLSYISVFRSSPFLFGILGGSMSMESNVSLTYSINMSFVWSTGPPSYLSSGHAWHMVTPLSCWGPGALRIVRTWVWGFNG